MSLAYHSLKRFFIGASSFSPSAVSILSDMASATVFFSIYSYNKQHLLEKFWETEKTDPIFKSIYTQFSVNDITLPKFHYPNL